MARLTRRAPRSGLQAEQPRSDLLPPPLPEQGVGPHFVLDEPGVIQFAPPEALNEEGNNIALLRSLHPRLRDLARSLADALARTNAHGSLATRFEDYRKIIDQELEQIDFALLYAEGVILRNTQVADAADTEEPALDSATKSTLESLLQLHGPFVAATTVGLAALDAEERYQRTPDQEQQYRTDAVAFAERLQNKPEVIAAAPASLVKAAAHAVNQGPNPQRSGVVATGALRNVAIVSAVGATVAGLPITGGLLFGTAGAITGALLALLGHQALTKSKPFEAIANAITNRLNELSEADLRAQLQPIARIFHAQRRFVLQSEPVLRNLAGNRETFSWLNNSLDWIKRASAGPERPRTSPPEPAPSSLPSPQHRPFPIPELIETPAGSFVMGIPEEESTREKTEKYDACARPLHAVTIAQPFLLCKYPVTRGEYAAFVEATGYGRDGGEWRNPGFDQTDRHPVVNVGADDAEAYADWLNRVVGPGWRLPSEAEWEYAARAGKAASRFWGNSFRQAARYAHVRGKGTDRVDARQPNAFGLHDMLGNAWEWTADPWHENYNSAPKDGSVWIRNGNVARRVVRGGSWLGDRTHVRAGVRLDLQRGNRDDFVGFRLARTL